MALKRSRTQLAGIVTAVRLLLTTGGCAASAGAGGTASAGSSAVDQSGADFTLYSSMGYAKATTEAFTKKTGIKVALVYDSGGPLLTKVSAEKSNPQWHALWIEGDMAFATLGQDGALASYTPKASYNEVGTKLVPADHTYAPVTSSTMAALLCNAVKVPTPPASYQDLLGDAWKGRLGMNDPSQSGPTYTFIAGVLQQMGGVSQGEEYFGKLKANGLKVLPTNGDTVHALETGAIDCGLVQSIAATGEILKVAPTAAFKPTATYLPQSTLLPGVIGISAKAGDKAKKDAEAFEDYILSPEGQKVMQSAQPQGASLYWPLIDGVTKLDALAPMPTAYQRLDPKVWGPQQGDIVTWFSNTIK